MKTSCPDEADLVAYAHQELDERKAAAVAEHIGTCTHCSEAIASERRFGAQLRQAMSRRLPEELRGRLVSLCEQVWRKRGTG